MRKKMLSFLVVMTMVFSAAVIVINTEITKAGVTGTPGVTHSAFGIGTSNYKYSTEYQTVVVNTTGLNASTTYTLYKPRYNCSAADGQAQLFEWETIPVQMQNGEIARIVTDSTPTWDTRTFDSGIILDRAGMWILDSDTSHSGNNVNSYNLF